jgi:hypothetical protein
MMTRVGPAERVRYSIRRFARLFSENEPRNCKDYNTILAEKYVLLFAARMVSIHIRSWAFALASFQPQDKKIYELLFAKDSTNIAFCTRWIKKLWGLTIGLCTKLYVYNNFVFSIKIQMDSKYLEVRVYSYISPLHPKKVVVVDGNLQFGL